MRTDSVLERLFRLLAAHDAAGTRPSEFVVSASDYCKVLNELDWKESEVEIPGTDECTCEQFTIDGVPLRVKDDAA